MPPGTPKTLGLEFSGIVAEVGEEIEVDMPQKWHVGDEVFGLVYGGAYAEFVVANKEMLIRKPAELSMESCGGMCEVRCYGTIE
jgi:NADPH:quinone reductase-like Zn-dependent oxidoreductase